MCFCFPGTLDLVAQSFPIGVACERHVDNNNKKKQSKRNAVCSETPVYGTDLYQKGRKVEKAQKKNPHRNREEITRRVSREFAQLPRVAAHTARTQLDKLAAGVP